MCKVFGVAGVNEENRGTIIQIMKDITPSMTKVEDDGLGYAAVDKDGNVFGEKWLKPEHAWKKKKKRKMQSASRVVPELDTPILSEFNDVVDAPSEIYSPPLYDTFGEGELKNAVAFILHSRLSTGGANSVKIENVHPFVKHGTALIHNGIVYNEEKFTKFISSCDSEILLNQYVEHDVNMDSRNIEESLKDVDAYFACLVLSSTLDRDEKIVPIMDIYQDGASLKVVHVHDLNATFFLTQAMDLLTICKEKGWTTSRYFQVKEDVLIRLNAVTGKVIEKEPFYYASYRYSSFDSWSSGEKEKYYMSRYGANYEKYEKEDNDAEPSYRQLEHGQTVVDEGDTVETGTVDERDEAPRSGVYDATRMPFADEMDLFRQHAETMGRKHNRAW